MLTLSIPSNDMLGLSDVGLGNNLILNLDNYKDINFEDLLSYVSYIVDYYYRNKIDLTIKHRDITFYLDQSLYSLNQILKYLANVKN